MIWLEQVDKELQVTAQETSSTKVFIAFSKLLFFSSSTLKFFSWRFSNYRNSNSFHLWEDHLRISNYVDNQINECCHPTEVAALPLWISLPAESHDPPHLWRILRLVTGPKPRHHYTLKDEARTFWLCLTVCLSNRVKTGQTRRRFRNTYRPMEASCLRRAF